MKEKAYTEEPPTVAKQLVIPYVKASNEKAEVRYKCRVTGDCDGME
jgi:hypothetical protein